MNNYYIFYTNNLFSEFEIINSGESFTYKFIIINNLVTSVNIQYLKKSILIKILKIN